MPMTAERPNEFGVAASGTYGVSLYDGEGYQGASGSIHYYRRLGSAGGLGVVGFGGNHTFGGLGVIGRINLASNDNVNLAIQPAAGWMWVGLSVPIAFRVAEGTWFHVNPSGGYRPMNFAELPVGISHVSRSGLTVSGELAASYGEETPILFHDAPGIHILSGRATFTMGYRFGGRKSKANP